MFRPNAGRPAGSVVGPDVANIRAEQAPPPSALGSAAELAIGSIAGVPRFEEYELSTLVKELVEAGVHFGHRASRWNPKMRPYIFARRNLIHIIEVRETVRGLLRAKKYLAQLASRNSLVLFVGTKRQAADTVARQAKPCGMP